MFFDIQNDGGHETGERIDGVRTPSSIHFVRRFNSVYTPTVVITFDNRTSPRYHGGAGQCRVVFVLFIVLILFLLRSRYTTAQNQSIKI